MQGACLHIVCLFRRYSVECEHIATSYRMNGVTVVPLIQSVNQKLDTLMHKISLTVYILLLLVRIV